MPKLALVTCVNLPEPDPDEAITIEAFNKAGIEVCLTAWDDPKVEWNQFDLAVLRSTWNYYENESAFRNWIDTTSSQIQLVNSPTLLHGNIDKTYLGLQETQGTAIVPTRFLSETLSLSDALDNTGWQEFVIKPTVSAGSFMTKKFNASQIDEAERFIAEMTITHSAMVQQFMPLVEQGGEIALVHVHGQLTHGVLKQPRFTGSDESVSSACQPSEEQAVVAKQVIDTISEPWLYARVDLMASTDGRWLLSELELIEPSLFFMQNPAALHRFVEATSRFI